MHGTNIVGCTPCLNIASFSPIARCVGSSGSWNRSTLNISLHAQARSVAQASNCSMCPRLDCSALRSPAEDFSPIMHGKHRATVSRLKKLYDPVNIISTCSSICSHAPTFRIETNGAISKNAAGISTTNVAATPRRRRSGCIWCAYHAKGPGS